MPIESVYCCLNCADLLSLLVRNVNSHILLHRDNDFNWVQRIETQLLECGSFRKFRLIAFCCSAQNFEYFCLNLLQKLTLHFTATKATMRMKGKEVDSARLWWTKRKHQSSEHPSIYKIWLVLTLTQTILWSLTMIIIKLIHYKSEFAIILSVSLIVCQKLWYCIT
jgi:hypothetical protein